MKMKPDDGPTRAERFMAARVRESDRLARDYEASLDPRQRRPEQIPACV